MEETTITEETTTEEATDVLTMDLIVVEQLPVIRESLKSLSAEIDDKLSIVNGLVCSEETLSEVKKVRAEFNKEFAAIEDVRKQVKTAVLTPYNEFEAIYRDCVSDKYKAADATLKAKIGEVEKELKDRKTAKIKVYFDEYASKNFVTEYADFERQMSGIRMSDSETQLKRICRERIDPLANGIKAIDAQPEELRAEILVEFKATLNALQAIAIVSERQKAKEDQRIQDEKRKAEQAKAEEAAATAAQAIPQPIPAPAPLAPPTAAPEPQPMPQSEDDSVRTVEFKVTHKLSKLRELKMYLINGGYEIE